MLRCHARVLLSGIQVDDGRIKQRGRLDSRFRGNDVFDTQFNAIGLAPSPR